MKGSSRDIIFCVLGCSGSGKTTLVNNMVKTGFNAVLSFTTRPPRNENEFGHIFVDDAYFKKLQQHNPESMIAYNKYNGFHYWAEEFQVKEKGVSFYVVDLPGVKMLKETCGRDYVIKTIFLHTDFNELEKRLIERGKDTERLEKDKKLFNFCELDFFVNTSYVTQEETFNNVLKYVKKTITYEKMKASLRGIK